MGMDKQGTAAENHRRRKSYVLPQDHIDGINYISEFAINPKVNDLDKSFVNILVDIDPLSDTPWDDSIYEEYGPRPLEG
jgi:hypothetical protein